MEGYENLKNEELETLKLKLLDMRRRVQEFRDRTAAMQKQHESDGTHHQKKMKNLSNIEATQGIRLAKLDGDIANTEQVFHSRLAEEKSLLKLIESNQNAIKAAAEETPNMIADFHEKCHNIEEEIKDVYVQIQSDEDMEELLEIAQNYFNDGYKLSLMYDVLCARREAIIKRRQDINKEYSEIEAVQTALNLEMKAKQEDLAKARELYSDLTKRHAALHRVKRGYFISPDFIPEEPNVNP